ncbi:NADP-dependent oxidoreductase domain-containing protein [Collybia nuda]|uniref:NADP-dependent oxidoreductase domain-containing protein n=1 Tax=Collybia nuda TaxID=64659 RepID=A0A9P5YHB9_9AGAR|nr:NADP-dependent oxidoreductase domain-containing protein [Collybia nuda]
MGIGGRSYGPAGSDEESFAVLDAAHAQGCTHWDTADLYNDSEALLGKWFKRTGKRSDIFLATKFGFTSNGIRGDPEHIHNQFNKSLETLGVDYIDLYYAHRVDSKTPIEVTVGVMAEYVKAGKVKYIGLSECSAKALRRAHAVHPIAAIQMEVSPLVLDVFDPKFALLETARELGVAIVAYSPLGRGLLSGQYKAIDELAAADFRRTIPKYAPENFSKINALSTRIKDIGAAHNATAAQVTLSWILAQGQDFFVIPGTKKIKYLEENIGAANVKLTPEEVAAVRKLADDADIPGDRYGEANQKLVYQDSPELGSLATK